MSARIVVRGRTQAASRDWRPARKPVVIDWSAVPVLPDTPPPVFDRGAGGAWRCPDTGIVYRVVDNIRLADGWCTAEQLARHYKCALDTVFELVRRGLIDAVMEGTAPPTVLARMAPTALVRRYRIRSPVEAKQAVLALRRAPPPKKKQPATAGGLYSFRKVR